MAKERPTTGTDGRPLPILPPQRDALTGLLVVGVGVTVLYGIVQLRKMQVDYDLRSPPKDEK